jgi:hypothetical protein
MHKLKAESSKLKAEKKNLYAHPAFPFELSAYSSIPPFARVSGNNNLSSSSPARSSSPSESAMTKKFMISCRLEAWALSCSLVAAISSEAALLDRKSVV